MRTAIKALANGVLAPLGVEIKKIPSLIPDPIHVWDTEEEFVSMYDAVRGHTLVSKVRMFMLYQTFLQASMLQGDVVEIGVYRGGTAKLFSLLNKEYKLNKKIHLFDTFGGMPTTSTELDLHKEGDFSDTSLEAVTEYVKDFQGVTLTKGIFPKTGEYLKDSTFSFAHVDVDIYQSVRDCCEFLYPRMIQGGIIMFDDYGFVSCPGAKKAVDEFFDSKKEKPIYLQSGQCMVVKL